MAELASIDHQFNAPSSSVQRIQEAQTTIYNVPSSASDIDSSPSLLSHPRPVRMVWGSEIRFG